LQVGSNVEYGSYTKGTTAITFRARCVVGMGICGYDSYILAVSDQAMFINYSVSLVGAVGEGVRMG
jgi:hypothetical protein